MLKRFLRRWLALTAIALPLAAAGQDTAPLSLVEAVRMTLANNPLHCVAMAETKAASATAREARAPLLPKITFAENFTGGNDPVFVFGAKLRQQEFTARDFALNQLNRPAPIGNYSSRFIGQWNLFDSTQSWKALERAKYLNLAAEQQLTRTDQELMYQTVQAYYAVLLAQKQVQVAENAVRTVEAIEADSRARVESGLAVDSDLLSAQVQASARQQELIARRNDLSVAQTRLALAMGAAADVVYQPQEALEERTLATNEVGQLETTALESRHELKRSEWERRAQDKGLAIAKAAFGPRLNAFGSWQEDSHSVGWTGAKNWVAGAELQLDLFAGGGKRAAVTREKALQERATYENAALQDAVRLEVRQAYYQFDAARQQVKVARGVISQAQESLRINRNRYGSGLSTVTALLQVEEATHRAEADYWEAVYRMHASYAGVELATGTLTVDSLAVTQ